MLSLVKLEKHFRPVLC